MAEEGVAVSNDVPVKRPREDGENVPSPTTVVMETEGNAENNNSNNDHISSVIPGWFSEISPMWPGMFLSNSRVYYA